jgi:hypothetical protein
MIFEYQGKYALAIEFALQQIQNLPSMSTSADSGAMIADCRREVMNYK